MQDTNQNKRTAALLGLPRFFAEDTSDIIKMCNVRKCIVVKNAEI